MSDALLDAILAVCGPVGVVNPAHREKAAVAQKEYHIQLALAVLDALADPSEAMLDAGYMAEAETVWRAMVAAKRREIERQMPLS